MSQVVESQIIKNESVWYVPRAHPNLWNNLIPITDLEKQMRGLEQEETDLSAEMKGLEEKRQKPQASIDGIKAIFFFSIWR